MLASILPANRWTRLARNGAIAVLCATCGVLALVAVHAFTHQLITSIFVVPVFADQPEEAAEIAKMRR